MNSKKISVAQLGSRMHYAVPAIFHECGILEKLYTDFIVLNGVNYTLKKTPPALQPSFLRRLNTRVPMGVPADKVISFNDLGILYAIKRINSKNEISYLRTIIWAAKEFSKKIIENLSNAEILYVFNGASLELIEYAKQNGITVLLEQTIAPKKIEIELIENEKRKFPDWVNNNEQHPDYSEFLEREKKEWMLADKIICGSPFVKNGICHVHGHSEKSIVIPYGVKEKYNRRLRKKSHREKLNILTVGEVGLRKGSPYVLEAAKRFKDQIRFRMVGNIKSSYAMKYSNIVDLTGPVTKNEIKSHYEWADIFLLPSVCEGSATVTYEALSAGLPVICTENTGSVVIDGINGFIIDISLECIVEKISLYLNNKALLSEQSQNALTIKENYSYEAYSERLKNLVNSL